MASREKSYIEISRAHGRLLKYIVSYRRLRGRATGRLVIEQLILAYAKQIATGMPEELWRRNIITLINECEVEHEQAKKREQQRRKELEARQERARKV